jgi:hypothetical protein
MDPKTNPSLNKVVKAPFDQGLATRPTSEYVGNLEAGDRANTYS